MTPVEEKEIKGITLKSLGWLIGSTISIMLTIILSVSGIKSSIDDVKTQLLLLQKDRDNDRVLYLDRYSTLNDRLNQIEGRQNENRKRIEELEKKAYVK